MLEYNTKNEVERFIDTTTSHNFFPTISLPTRITDKTSTLIDNIFITPDENKYESGNFLTGISDHLAQFLIPNSSSSAKFPNTKTSYRNWNSWKKDSFLEDFKKTNWNKLLVLENNNPDYSFERFFEKLSELIESHVPLKQLSKKQLKSASKPWITKGIKKSIVNRDNLLKKFHREKRVELRTALYHQYKFFRNKLVDLIRQSKSNHYINFFDELISTKKRSSVANILLDVGGQLTSNQEIVADSFKKYFTQIAVKIKSKLPPVHV